MLLFHFCWLSCSNTWLKLHLGPLCCLTVHLLSISLWFSFFPEKKHDDELIILQLKFLISFSIIHCHFDYIMSLLLCFRSASLIWYYSVHLPTTLIFPISSSSWLISSGISPFKYPVSSLAFCTTMLPASEDQCHISFLERLAFLFFFSSSHRALLHIIIWFTFILTQSPISSHWLWIRVFYWFLMIF